jgi:hypothetical protein
MILLSLGLSMRADTSRKKTIMGSKAKDMIHISDKEAAGDHASVLACVREGAEVTRFNSFRWLKELFPKSPLR